MDISNFVNNTLKIKDFSKLQKIILNNYKLLIKSNSEQSKKLKEFFFKLAKKKAIRNIENYYIFLTKDQLNLNIFKIFLLFYYLELKNSKTKYIGIEIFIIHPDQLDKNWKLFFIEKILCNEYSFKILHGSDSLDLPYIYDELLHKNSTLIIKFNRQFADTKFLCEYSFYNKNLTLGKCKIYELLNMENIINQKKYDEIKLNEEKMGPIYDIKIDINNLSDKLIDYSFYDVLYLDKLLKNYENKDYFKLIIELTQLVMMDKRNIQEIVPKEEINKINNYILFKNNDIKKLVEIFNLFYKKLEKNYLINNLLKINYFKQNIIFVIKFELYSNLLNKYIIYEKLSEKKIYNKNLLNNKLNYLDKLNFKNFVNLIKKNLKNFNF
jgi:hypothetical protein